MTIPRFRKGDRVRWAHLSMRTEGVVSREPYEHNGGFMFWVRWDDGEEADYYESDLLFALNGVEWMLRLL